MKLSKINPRNFPNLEEKTLNTDKKKRDECIMGVTDSQGKTNLCCCYVIDDYDMYENACYLPVADCC